MAGRFSVEAAFMAVDNYTATVAKMSAATDKMIGNLSKGVDRINHLNDRVLGGLKAVGAAVASAGAVAGAGLFNIGKSGADFEQAITSVGAVSLMTRDQIAELEKKARELGRTSRFSATEVANGMEVMARAGLKNGEIVTSIDGVIAAATAEGATFDETANVIMATMKGMGLAFDQTGRVADVLAMASNLTSSSITSLGESMAIASSTARQFKIPFEQVVASVALLQDVGLDASTAGTAVSTMLTKLAAPTAKASKEIAELGLKFQDMHGNMLPLPEIFGQFEKASKKAGGNMKAVAFFSELVGLRGEKAVLNMKELFASGRFGELVKQLEAAAGTAQEMADLKLNNFTDQLKILGHNVEDLEISLFNLVGGSLKDVVVKMTKWIDANRDLVTSKAAEYAKEIGDNLPAIVKWTERIAIGVGSFIAMSLAVKAASVAIAAFELVLGAASAAGSILSFTIGAIRAVMLSETLATVASTAATAASTAARWLWNAALAAARIATTGFTISQGASTVAVIAGTVATWARNAAQWAVNAVVVAGTAIATAYRLVVSGEAAAVIAATAASVARRVALGAQAVVTGVVTGATKLYAIATGEATAATVAAEASLAPLLVTFAALAAAIGAVMVAWDQLKKLTKETGGAGFFGTANDWISQGMPSAKNYRNTAQNEQAEADAASADTSTPSISSGQDYGAGAGPVTGEITVRAEPGTSAKVTKKPAGGFGLRALPRSGGLAPSGGR